MGSEVAKNTPDVDLTKNPKELGEQAGDAVKDAGKEVAKQSPLNFITMLDLPSPQVQASPFVASLKCWPEQGAGSSHVVVSHRHVLPSGSQHSLAEYASDMLQASMQNVVVLY